MWSAPPGSGPRAAPAADLCPRPTALHTPSAGVRPPPPPAYTPPPPYSGPPTYPVPAPAPKSGGSALKIVLIVLVVIFVLGAAGVISVAYMAYRVKNRITQEANRRGVDLSAFSNSAAYQGRMPDPCSLLTKEEASEIAGLTIERTEEHGRTCDYYAQPLSPAQQQERMRKALEEIQTRSKQHAADAATPAGDATAAARASGVENLTKTMAAGANPGSGPYFSIQVNQNGRAQIAGMKIALGAVSPGMRTVEPISGIGDEAIMGPMDSMLVFTKNGLGVQIDLRQMPQGRDHAIAMAQRILPRL
jgi:hypothetical protein